MQCPKSQKTKINKASNRKEKPLFLIFVVLLPFDFFFFLFQE